LVSHKAAPSAKIIAIGASTGGTEAIKVVAKHLTAQTPPVLLLSIYPQHLVILLSNILT